MRSERDRAAAILALVLAAGCTTEASKDYDRAADPLKSYTTCKFTDGLEAVAVDHLSADVKSRTVETKEGKKQVSMADGYRLMLAYPSEGAFVNLKVEKSAQGRFGADKQAIVEGMDFMSSQARGGVVPLEHKRMGRLDVFAINNPALHGPGPVSMYTLFDDGKEIVITAYVLSQSPERRKFQTIGEYRELRDRFLETYVKCVS